jgi:proline iminopeptidase
MRRAIKTAPFLGADGEVIRGSIAEARYVCLGGLEQWVMIRGENIDNPVLVVLHGGPGLTLKARAEAQASVASASP